MDVEERAEASFLEDVPSLEEVRRVCREMKRGKAGGVHGNEVADRLADTNSQDRVSSCAGVGHEARGPNGG